MRYFSRLDTSRHLFRNYWSDPSYVLQAYNRDLFVTCQIVADNKPLTIPHRTSFKAFKNTYTWNEWITFPIKYRDLPLNAQITFTAWDIEGPRTSAPVGGTTFRMFGKKSTLRRGKHRLLLWAGQEADGSTESRTPSKVELKDEMGRLEKLVKKHERGDLPKSEWLDKMAFRRMEEIHAAETAKSESLFLYIDVPRFDFPVLFTEQEALNIPPSTTAHPTTIPSAVPAPAGAVAPLMDFKAEMQIWGIIDPDIARENPVEDKHRRLVRGHRGGPLDRELKPDAKTRDELTAIINYPPTQPLSSEDKDLIWKFRFYLSRDPRALTKFLKAVTWKDASEVKQAVEVLLPMWTEVGTADALELLGPSTSDSRVRSFAVKQLKRAEDDELLLYLLQLVQALKFESPLSSSTKDRDSGLADFLVERGAAHPVLGNRLNWYLMVEMEDKMVKKMYAKVAFEFQRQLNESDTAAQRRMLRSHLRPGILKDHGRQHQWEEPLLGCLVKRGQEADGSTESRTPSKVELKDEMGRLEKLVKKHERGDLPKSEWLDKMAFRRMEEIHAAETAKSESLFLYIDVPRFDFPVLFTEQEALNIPPSTTAHPTTIPSAVPAPAGAVAPLMDFKAEMQIWGIIDPDIARENPVEDKHRRLVRGHRGGPLDRELKPDAKTRDELTAIINYPPTQPLSSEDKDLIWKFRFYLSRDPRALTKFLKAVTWKDASEVKQAVEVLLPMWTEFCCEAPPLPLPLNARIMVTGLVPEKCSVLKSNLQPLKLTFKCASESGSEAEEYSVIFKNGDDLRQDQLVIQLFTLMDRLLRKENLDLKLTPYDVLATSSMEGMIQFIPSSTIRAIIEEYSSVLGYLRAHYPDEGSVGTYGVKKDVIETFVRSCAGYCVVTYILGVGDRHLDNLLVAPDGHFFHVDFGYILGRDPKPFPPPVKVCKEMVDAMGGAQSSHYARFKNYCFTAFSILRKSANLILNLVALMVDANIPDIKHRDVHEQIQEKFRLDLTEEDAIKHFETLLNETSYFTVMFDRIHDLAQYWRS
ncbi:hypothetical protein RSAG8_05660, partial [Rhizoctonia solani AG-8 WAC10335]